MFFFLGIDVKISYGVLMEISSQKKRVGMDFKVHILNTIL